MMAQFDYIDTMNERHLSDMDREMKRLREALTAIRDMTDYQDGGGMIEDIHVIALRALGSTILSE